MSGRALAEHEHCISCCRVFVAVFVADLLAALSD
jgi:hypothetical protein